MTTSNRTSGARPSLSPTGGEGQSEGAIPRQTGKRTPANQPCCHTRPADDSLSPLGGEGDRTSAAAGNNLNPPLAAQLGFL